MFRQQPGKYALWMLWHYCYMDSKTVFQNKASMTQQDIKEACEEAGILLSPEIRMVPLDPTKPTSRKNFAFVSVKARGVLARIWRHSKGGDMYRVVLEKELEREVAGKTSIDRLVASYM